MKKIVGNKENKAGNTGTKAVSDVLEKREDQNR